MAQIKEKIKHMLHQDKASDKPVTTPDASPGFADVTTHVPEAYFPGSRPVVPDETHSLHPYSSALGQHQVPPGIERSTNQSPQLQPTAVPTDSAAMMGAPPTDGGLNQINEAPEESEREGIVTPSDSLVESKELPLADTGAKNYSAGTESEVQTKGTEPDVQIEEIPGNESKVQTEDYPTTGEVVERKDNPGTESEAERQGEEFVPADEKFEQESAQENA